VYMEQQQQLNNNNNPNNDAAEQNEDQPHVQQSGVYMPLPYPQYVYYHPPPPPPLMDYYYIPVAHPPLPQEPPPPPTTSSSSRRKKDPAAPKNPKSAYLFFLTEQRSQLSGCVVDFGEFARDLGVRWRGLSDSERAPYVELARIDKERYVREKEQYGSGRRVFRSVP
jgi:hypothetical protein